MKKYLIYIITLGLIFSTACDPKTFDPVLVVGDIQSAAITTPAAGTAIVMTEAEADKTLTFKWSETNYGFDAAVTYSLQADFEGGDFSEPIALGNSTEASLTLTYESINSILLSKGIPENAPTNMLFRVLSSINDDVEDVASATTSLTITLYKVEINYPILSVPGSYQGWNPQDSVTAIYDRNIDGNYEGFLFMAGSGVEFKFADAGLGWDLNWGDTGADGQLDEGGDNILAPGEGMHRLRVNLNDFTYSVEATNWGLIGDATGSWDNDQDMAYNEATRALELTLDLAVGEIKFRANDDWALNFGDDAANGTLEYDGANIAISEAGNYTIQLFLSDADYTYTVTKN